MALDATAPSRAAVSPEDMLVFAAVARAGGIRRGAEALDLPRSTVSQKLERLERAVGGSLVLRTTRRFALTDLGKSLLEQCSRMESVLRETQDVLARAAREPSGVLTIAASPIIGEELLPPVLAEYALRYPRVRLNVRLSVGFVDLRREGIDVGIRTGPLEEADDLYFARLGSSPKGLFAGPSYLERRGAPSSAEDLAHHDCIVIGDREEALWSLSGRGGPTVPVAVRGTLRVDSYRLARSAAAAGMGIARLPSFFAAPLVQQGELVPLLEKSWPVTTLYAVHAAGRPYPAKIRALLALLHAIAPRLVAAR